MKKTCKGCKAFNLSHKQCELGLDIQSTINEYGLTWIPIVDCPKPRTYADLLEAKEVLKVNR